MKNTDNLGWIGLGNMGMPMANNLIKAGYNMHIYARDITSKKSIIDQGATAYDHLPDFIKQTQCIFLTLPDDKTVEQVFLEITKQELQGKTFINCSTISPELAQNLAHQLQQKNAVYIDAPVSGSVLPATQGTLSFLVGAQDIQTYQKQLPYFEIMGKHTYYTGLPGMGSKAKLAINYYMAVVVQGFAETISYGKKLGLDPVMMSDIVNQSAVGSAMTQIKTPSVLNNEFPAAFPLKFMVKDLLLAQNNNWNSDLLQSVLSTYTNALEQGEQENDLMAVIKVVKG